MADNCNRPKQCSVVVRAGPIGESEEIFGYVTSVVPDWVERIDDPAYKRITTAALQAATETVRKTGKVVTLDYSAFVDN
jgi:hypothetical protein